MMLLHVRGYFECVVYGFYVGGGRLVVVVVMGWVVVSGEVYILIFK